jgi:hypothetical protein
MNRHAIMRGAVSSGDAAAAVLFSHDYESGVVGTGNGQGHVSAGYTGLPAGGDGVTMSFSGAPSIVSGALIPPSSAAWTGTVDFATTPTPNIYAHARLLPQTVEYHSQIRLYTSAAKVLTACVRLRTLVYDEGASGVAELYTDNVLEAQTGQISGNANAALEIEGTSVKGRWATGTTITDTLGAARTFHAGQIYTDQPGIGGASYHFDNVFFATQEPTPSWMIP